MTLAVVIGLLRPHGRPPGAAGVNESATPKATITMLDYEGQTVVTYSAAPVGSITAPGQRVR